jgi:hypothetical protein
MKNQLLISMIILSSMTFNVLSAGEYGGEEMESQECIFLGKTMEPHTLMVKQTSGQPLYYQVAPADFYEIDRRINLLKEGHRYGAYQDTQAVLLDKNENRVNSATISTEKIRSLIDGLNLQ